MSRHSSTGTGVAVEGVVALLGVILLMVLAFRAATAPPGVYIVGTVVGPCDVQPSSAVEIRAGDEIAGTGSIGTWNWEPGAKLCHASISVSDVDFHDTYTVDAGTLTGTVKQRAIHDMMTIRLWKK